MKKKTGLNDYVYNFSIDYNIINTSNIINIHKYSMKKHNIKHLGLLKKYYHTIYHNIVNASNHIKFVLLSNHQCMTQPTLINLHPNEYT